MNTQDVKLNSEQAPEANKNKKKSGMLIFRVYFPKKLFAAAGLITICHSPPKKQSWDYRQKET